MNGSLILYPEIPENDNLILCFLLEPSEHYDGHCTVILSVVSPAIAKLGQKVYKDHLPGGWYEALDIEEMRQTSRSVAKHNKFCETVFAFYDKILKNQPQISTLSSEAHIMFTFNKSSAWLDAKEEDEVANFMRESYKEVQKVRANFKLRQVHIQKQRASRLRESS